LQDLLKKTPLREGDIHHTSTAQNVGDRLHVTQMVMRRKYIEESATSIGMDAEDFAFVEMPSLASGTDGSGQIRLYKNQTEKPWLPMLGLALVTMLVTLGCIAAALQYRQQQVRLDDLAARLTEARARAQAVRANVDAANQQISTANQLRSRKRDGIRLLQLWEELSRILPADSWVSELRISKGEKNTLKVTLTGFSAAAANLVGVVDQSPLFHTVSLTAPIAIDPVEQRERFVLQASVDDTPGEKTSR
jgi:general secretion pathway protein L